VRVQFCGIQSEGEMFLIHDLYGETKESNDGCMRLLSEVEDLLDAELANDKKMRSSFGFKWSRPRSEEVATEYHHDLSKARKYMEQACIAQEKIERAMVFFLVIYPECFLEITIKISLHFEQRCY
jgi:hypothetical protein